MGRACGSSQGRAGAATTRLKMNGSPAMTINLRRETPQGAAKTAEVHLARSWLRRRRELDGFRERDQRPIVAPAGDNPLADALLTVNQGIGAHDSCLDPLHGLTAPPRG
jgi:hypothetical protein